jgi:hypothetical protein
MLHTFLVAHTRSGEQYVLNTGQRLQVNTCDFLKLNEQLLFLVYRKITDYTINNYYSVKAVSLTYIPLS